MAVPLRPEEVPKDLICAICLSLPTDPWIAKKCGHVFCKDCIQCCLCTSPSCPVCRVSCTKANLSLLSNESSLGYRIWSSIAVKCENHEKGCGWTGTISDYRSHRNSCPNKGRNQNTSDEDKALIRSLRDENSTLKEQLEDVNISFEITKEELETKVRRLTRENEDLLLELREAEETSLRLIGKCDNLKAKAEKGTEKPSSTKRSSYDSENLLKIENEELREELRIAEEKSLDLMTKCDSLRAKAEKRAERPVTDRRGGYAYDRRNVVKLAKLICQDLLEKPPSINAVKIFECVKKICSDLRREREGNPEHLYIDVRMLLGICQASAWFNDHQQLKFEEISAQNGWSGEAFESYH